MLLILVSIAFMVGVFVGDALHLPMLPLLAVAAASGFGAMITGRLPAARMLLLALCAASLGGARLAAAQVQPTPQSIWLLNGSGEQQIRGVVVEDPRRTDSGQRATINADSVLRGGRWVPAEGAILATLPAYPERRYGDRLELTGVLKTPRPPKRSGEFDYQQYLARKQVFSLLAPTAVTQLGQNRGNPLLAALLGVRDNARHVLLRELPEPQASLAVGILLGIQSSIPADVLADFSVTGTSHILVISGWNISIIGAALYALAARMKLSRDSTFWAILVLIWLYTLFVGATPTVIRAAVMGSIVVLGQRLDRQSHAWTTLLAACAAMTVWNPQTLWDLGFQLSALATASLFAFGKPIDRMLGRTFLKLSWLAWAREALTATLAAQILALPLILYQFGNLSIVAPLANVMLLPMVPYAMLFSALALVAGLIWLPLGQLLAMPAYLFLGWLTEGVRLFALLPWAAMRVPPFPLWVLLAYYALVLALWLGRRQALEPAAPLTDFAVGSRTADGLG